MKKISMLMWMALASVTVVGSTAAPLEAGFFKKLKKKANKATKSATKFVKKTANQAVRTASKTASDVAHKAVRAGTALVKSEGRKILKAGANELRGSLKDLRDSGAIEKAGMMATQVALGDKEGAKATARNMASQGAQYARDKRAQYRQAGHDYVDNAKRSVQRDVGERAEAYLNEELRRAENFIADL